MKPKPTGYKDINGVELFENMETNKGIIVLGTDGRWRVLNNIPVPDLDDEPQGVVGTECFLEDILDEIE